MTLDGIKDREKVIKHNDIASCDRHEYCCNNWCWSKPFSSKYFEKGHHNIYTITDEPTWNAPVKISNAGRFQRTKTLKAVDL